MVRPLIFGCLLWLVSLGTGLAQQGQNEARIGVLAYRGSDQLQLRWTSLRDYLNAAIPGWSFQIVPMTLSSADEQIEAGQLDFIITNPGHFVVLNRSHRMSVIASRSQKKSDGTFSGEFGSAIIARKDSDIKVLQDVAGKTVAAIDRSAFGGFQLAWYEFDRVGVDLFTDAAALRFVGFPMDQIVMQVLRGDADVGIVRSGLIEALAKEGRIDPEALLCLNSNVTYSHPDMVSTDLYPEWPFAALAATAPALKDRVALALLLAGQSPLAQEHGMIDMWSAPVSYHRAFELTDAFQTRIRELTTNEPAFPSLAAWALIGFAMAAGVAFWRRTALRSAEATDAEITHNKADAAGLTKRERQILDLVAHGLSTKEIAIDLGISPKTVEFHRSNLLRKFGARTSSQLVALAT